MSVFTTSSDESLIEQTLAGDDRAFGELMNRYSPIVMAWLSANNENRGENEDLAQEAFLSGYRRLASLRNRRKFGPWLVRIARNQLVDFRRKKGREVRTANLDADTLEKSADRVNFQQNVTAGPKEHASAAETVNLVTEAIVKLGDTYRDILYMRLIDEETPKAIAHRLGLKESTVRMRLQRGLKKLQKMIQID